MDLGEFMEQATIAPAFGPSRYDDGRQSAIALDHLVRGVLEVDFEHHAHQLAARRSINECTPAPPAMCPALRRKTRRCGRSADTTRAQ